jgi:hypothetical protein
MVDLIFGTVVNVLLCVGQYCLLVAGRQQVTACQCLNAVPVHIVTGEQVSKWCPDCGKTVYMARWIFQGE